MSVSARRCDIFRCTNKEGMYLYVDADEQTERVPEDLLKRCGRLDFAMTLDIEPQKKLAHANAEKVLQSISDNGFYLQMPPPLTR